MKNTLAISAAIAHLFIFTSFTYAHHASFESDLTGQDSTLENPWSIGDVHVAYDHFSILGEGDVDYITFDGTAGQEVSDLVIVFPASLSFLPHVAIAGPGLSGGSIPDWAPVPDGLGIMNYEYATDWLTEEAFGELENIIVLSYDEPRPFTLPETGVYWLIIYHEEQKPGYYSIAHGEDHSIGAHAEDWEQKLDAWIQAALAFEQASVSDWELLD
ncbi:MAG: hypothetical protein JXR73_02825 [Candidatus Omnitrophica bacterium]|nr:hypothetical protein [Candidatus Omnitrophota bacterium]